jgi:hypothetical protein
MADTAEQSVSLRDDLSKIYDSQESGETPEPEVEAEAEEEAAEEKKGMARDESGKFVKDEGETEEAPEVEAEPEEQTETPEPGLEAPQHWSATDKAVFAKQPKEAQEFLLRRHKDMEADYTRKTQEVAETKRFKDSFDQLLSPHRQTFAMNGLDDVGGVRYLLGWYQSLQQNPAGTIQSLAQQYGVDFSQNQGAPADPSIKPLLDKIQFLESQIAQTNQAQQYQVSSTLESQVNSFRDERDATGNVKHPHFEKVRQDMSVLIGSGRAKTLPEAYELAVRLHPDIHDKSLEQSILEKQKAAQQEAQKKATDEAQKKAAQAKKAATGIRSGSASVENKGPQDLRAQLSELYDKQVAS